MLQARRLSETFVYDIIFSYDSLCHYPIDERIVAHFGRENGFFPLFSCWFRKYPLSLQPIYHWG